MKSVLVCAAQAPFVTGGAEIHVRELVKSLAARGFRVDVVSVPFHAHPPSEVVRQALAWRLLELRHTTGESVDLVIPTKFPSYLVRHHRKVAWVFHQYREAYELLGTEHSPLGSGPEDARLVETIRTMDKAALGECRALFTNSKNVADRLARYNGLHATPLYPPPQQLGRYRCDAYSGFLLAPGRLERTKRPELLLRALALATKEARLKLTGEGPLRRDLERLAAQLGIEGRVDFLGFVPEDELLALYATCRGVLYAPFDEDFGYVTVEGFLSRKPVVTASDSGGPLEFVEDGASGFVAAPEPAALADAIDRLWRLSETAAARDGRRRRPARGLDQLGDRRGPADRARPVRVALWTPTPDAAWVAALRGRARARAGAHAGARRAGRAPAGRDRPLPRGRLAGARLRLSRAAAPAGDRAARGVGTPRARARGDGRAGRSRTPTAARRGARTATRVSSWRGRCCSGSAGCSRPSSRSISACWTRASRSSHSTTRRTSARRRCCPAAPVVHLPLDRAAAGAGAAALASALRALVLELAPRAEAERREIAARTAQERSLLGSALGELRWAARELGLAEPPADALALVARALR